MRTIILVLILFQLSACTTTYKMYDFYTRRNQLLETGHLHVSLKPEKRLKEDEDMRAAWPFKLKISYDTKRRDIQAVELMIHAMRGRAGKLVVQQKNLRQEPLSANVFSLPADPTPEQLEKRQFYTLYAHFVVDGLDIDYETQYLEMNLRFYDKHSTLVEDTTLNFTLHTDYSEESIAEWLYALGW